MMCKGYCQKIRQGYFWFRGFILFFVGLILYLSFMRINLFFLGILYAIFSVLCLFMLNTKDGERNREKASSGRGGSARGAVLVGTGVRACRWEVVWALVWSCSGGGSVCYSVCISHRLLCFGCIVAAISKNQDSRNLVGFVRCRDYGDFDSATEPSICWIG